jgi:hypothetical protein
MTTRATTYCRYIKIRSKACFKDVWLFCANTFCPHAAETASNNNDEAGVPLLKKHQVPPGPGLCAQLLSALGYDDDAFKPANSRWIEIYDRDAQKEEKKYGGKVLMSLDIVPKEWADQHPAVSPGRDFFIAIFAALLHGSNLAMCDFRALVETSQTKIHGCLLPKADSTGRGCGIPSILFRRCVETLGAFASSLR